MSVTRTRSNVTELTDRICLVEHYNGYHLTVDDEAVSFNEAYPVWCTEVGLNLEPSDFKALIKERLTLDCNKRLVNV